MPAAAPQGFVRVTDLHNAYGFMDQPSFAGTDRLADLGYTNTFESDGICYDPVLQAVYAEPMFVPHHNLRSNTDWLGLVYDDEDELTETVMPADETARDGLPAYPSLFWTLIGKTVQTDFETIIFAPHEYTGLRAALTPGKQHDPANLGFLAECTLPDPTVGLYLFKRQAEGDDQGGNRLLAFDLYVDTGVCYSIRYVGGVGIELWLVDGETSTRIGTIQSTQSAAAVIGQERARTEEMHRYSPIVHLDHASTIVLLANKILQIWAEGAVKPFVVACDHDEFMKVQVRADGGRYCYFSVHPMMFRALARMVSNEHNAGFVRRASTEILYRVLPDDPRVTPSTAWEQGTEFRYGVDFANDVEGSYKGVNYARTSAIVRQVDFEIAPVVVRRNDIIAEYTMRECHINIRFDPVNFNIYSTCKLVMNNRQGEWKNGWAYDGGRGNRAVQIDLGWDLENGSQPRNRRFTGIGGLDWDYSRGPAPESTVVITCEDLSVICRDYPLMNVPWMDGWCHLYAIRYLARLSGIADDQMDFELCSDPFCSDPDHYHLPIGEGGHPLMYFSPGTTAWQAMNQIRSLTGHMLYFDVYGRLKYYPWVRTDPGPYKRTFYDQPAPGLDDFQAIERVGFSSSTRHIRTGVTVIGVDAYGPAWRPIISRRDNEDALYNKHYSGYVGYRRPWAKVDSIFATQEAADAARDAFFEVASTPYETLTLSNMLAMSDLYPLDVIGLFDSEIPSSEGAVAKAFFIVETTERFVATQTHRDYRMDVIGRWIV